MLCRPVKVRLDQLRSFLGDKVLDQKACALTPGPNVIESVVMERPEARRNLPRIVHQVKSLSTKMSLSTAGKLFTLAYSVKLGLKSGGSDR